jgi:hypothetical protein
MNPGHFNLELYRGDSYAWRFILWQDDARTDPLDLTGATVAAEIREKSAGTHIVDLDVTVTLPNVVDVAMTPTMYATCPSKGVWDLQISFADGTVHTPVAGTVTVVGDVTDSVAMPVRTR